jgi:hypothetical protein
VKFTKHIPGFVDMERPPPFDFTTKEELVSNEQISGWSEKRSDSDPFHRFSISVQPSYDGRAPKHHLMAELNEGTTWWVVGYIEATEEELASLELPTWEAKK